MQTPPLMSTGTAVAVVVAAYGLAALAVHLFRRWAKRTSTDLDDAVARHLSLPLRWAVPVASLRLAVPMLPLRPAWSEPLGHAVVVATTLAFGWVAFRGLKVLEHLLLARYDLSEGDNLRARAVHTQVRAFRNIAAFLVLLLTVAMTLMTFDTVRELGAGLLASAGVAGIVIGFAAQRSIATVVAGIQLALAQPIRLDDVVVIDGHWGRVEEIALTYVVVCVWDQRRLVVPVTRIMEQPFENWTRTSAELLGTVELELDFTAPIEPLRQHLRRILEDAPEWDGRVAIVQVTEVRARSIVVRVLVSAGESGQLFDLRCRVREHLIAFVAERFPEAIPTVRAHVRDGSTTPPPRRLGQPEPRTSEGPAANATSPEPSAELG